MPAQLYFGSGIGLGIYLSDYFLLFFFCDGQFRPRLPACLLRQQAPPAISGLKTAARFQGALLSQVSRNGLADGGFELVVARPRYRGSLPAGVGEPEVEFAVGCYMRQAAALQLGRHAMVITELAHGDDRRMNKVLIRKVKGEYLRHEDGCFTNITEPFF
jgi:hypothetical protein